MPLANPIEFHPASPRVPTTVTAGTKWPAALVMSCCQSSQYVPASRTTGGWTLITLRQLRRLVSGADPPDGATELAVRKIRVSMESTSRLVVVSPNTTTLPASLGEPLQIRRL